MFSPPLFFPLHTFLPVHNFPQAFPLIKLLSINHDPHLHSSGFSPLRKIFTVNHCLHSPDFQHSNCKLAWRTIQCTVGHTDGPAVDCVGTREHCVLLTTLNLVVRGRKKGVFKPKEDRERQSAINTHLFFLHTHPFMHNLIKW